MKRTHQGGLTLVELLVVLVILGMLGTMSYRALSAATESRTRLEQEYADWRALARALARIDGDLQQVAARDPDGPALTLKRLPDDGNELSFWRVDSVRGARLTGFRLTGTTLELLRWQDGNPDSAPRRDTLLEGVTSLRWAFADPANNEWQTQPPSGGIPGGIALEIDTVRYGKINRIFALR